MPGRPAVWNPSLRLRCRTLCSIASVPVRWLLTKKIAPPPSAAWLPARWLLVIVSLKRLPSL
jgi:hypothetical protein